MNPLLALDPADQALEDLGLPRLLEALAARARTDLGRSRALGRGPQGDAEGVRAALALVEEARLLAGQQRALPLGGVGDVRAAVERARRGAMLEARELVEAAGVLSASARTKDFLASQSKHAPLLAAIGAALTAQTPLARRIENAFEPSGEVSRSRQSGRLAAVRDQSREACIATSRPGSRG